MQPHPATGPHLARASLAQGFGSLLVMAMQLPKAMVIPP